MTIWNALVCFALAVATGLIGYTYGREEQRQEDTQLVSLCNQSMREFVEESLAHVRAIERRTYAHERYVLARDNELRLTH